MSLTIVATKVEAWDELDTLVFTLNSVDKQIHNLKIDTSLTLDSMGELFEAIREAVQIMELEKTVDGAE